jgi:hypothetical protein
MKIDLDHFRQFGSVRIERVVPVALCERLTTVLETGLDVPIHDAARWDEYGGDGHDLLPIWGHQAQWDIRQHPTSANAPRLVGAVRHRQALRFARFVPLHAAMGGTVTQSPMASIGTTIRGLRRRDFCKAFSP